jgi:glycogen debranching enzyme
MNRRGLVEHSSEWGSFTVPATDEVLSVEPAPSWTGEGAIDMDAILAALSAGGPLLSAGMWPDALTSSDIGSDYSEALFPRDLFISLLSLAVRYPIERFLPVVDEVFRHQDRDREPGKLFHENRDPSTALARRISAITGCTWPWYAADDVTGDGANYVMELALSDPSILKRRVGDISYGDAVMAALGWELRRMRESGRHLILSRRLPRPDGSTWMPPIGSVWKDSPDGFVRPDGTLPTRPVALVEVQCILYRSLRLAARLGLGDSREFDHLADAVRAEFFDTFWVGDDPGGFPGYFAELDESGRTLVVAPTAASCLIDTVLCGILDGREHADRFRSVMRHLYDPDLGLRGALGPRSLTVAAPHYYPSGGDKGAVWPYLNDRLATAAAVRGFHRCAHLDDLLVLRICEATHSVPEFVPDAADPGFDRVRVKVRRARPEPYVTTAIEPAKPWQLWTLGALARASSRAAAYRRDQPRSSSNDVAELDEELAALARQAAVV